MPVIRTDKVFAPTVGGPVEADWGDAVAEAVVQSFTDTSARDAQWTTPPAGAMCVVTTPSVIVYLHNGTQWNPLSSNPTGTIIDFWGTAAQVPAGYLECNGATIPVNGETAALRALVGNTTPNLVGRVTVGAGAGTAGNTVGKTFGQETIAQHRHTMGNHKHTIAHTHSIDPPSTDGAAATGFKVGSVNVSVGTTGMASRSGGATGTWSINLPAFTSGGSSAGSSGNPSTNNTDNTGNGATNHQPSVTVRKCIKI